MSMEFSQKSETKELACVKNNNSSFASAMLCFLNGFHEGDQKNATKDQKTFRFRLLRKSRSSSNFQATTSASSSMMVPKRSHTRTQSAVMPSLTDVSGASRAVETLAGSASAASLLQVHRSPSHRQSVFTKVDKASLKLLSTSSPTMTAQSQLTTPPSPKPTKEETVHAAPKSRQKKFHRHFPSVDIDEKVLNYYSCALIADILLQGHLYITKNYFAFYSNVFGYVTKLLIPMRSVEKITKERTARIIPNAVGITTVDDDKHVFGSLMSRESTYKYMTKVWEVSQKSLEVAFEPEVLVEPENVEIAASETDSSEVKEESEKESTAQSLSKSISDQTLNSHSEVQHKHIGYFSTGKYKIIEGYRFLWSLPTHTLILLAVTFLLIILFLSAALLLYRVGKIHDEYLSLIEGQNLSSNDIYSNLLRFSMQLHSKSVDSMHTFVDSNLQQIAKVRQDLELLSSLLLPKDSSLDAKENQQDVDS